MKVSEDVEIKGHSATSTKLDAGSGPVTDTARRKGWLETVFERALWSTRYAVVIAVISSAVIALGLFIIGTVDIARAVEDIWQSYVLNDKTVDLHAETLALVMGAIDIYLIAVVLLIFSLGLYELFVSQIDPAKKSETANILEINDLDELKHKLAQVIIMALIVRFFQFALTIHLTDLTSLAVLAACILGLSLSIFLMLRTKHIENRK